MAKLKPAPSEVIIAEEQQPVPVEIIDDKPKTISKEDGQTLPPTTTAQQDKQSEFDSLRHEATEIGQRAINLIWETTQSRIAQVVVGGGVGLNSLVVVLVVFYDKEVTTAQLALVSICLQFINLTVGIVIGFYFSRTNHQNQGGVGQKPDIPYAGR